MQPVSASPIESSAPPVGTPGTITYASTPNLINNCRRVDGYFGTRHVKSLLWIAGLGGCCAMSSGLIGAAVGGGLLIGSAMTGSSVGTAVGGTIGLGSLLGFIGGSAAQLCTTFAAWHTNKKEDHLLRVIDEELTGIAQDQGRAVSIYTQYQNPVWAVDWCGDKTAARKLRAPITGQDTCDVPLAALRQESVLLPSAQPIATSFIQTVAQEPNQTTNL